MKNNILHTLRQVSTWLIIVVIVSLLSSVGVFAQTDRPPNPATDPDRIEAGTIQFLPLVSRGSVQISIPNPFFGVEMSSEMTNSNLGGPVDLSSRMGAGIIRTNGLLWSTVEPNPGDRFWDPEIDQRILSARKYNLSTILIIRSTPTWAQKAGNFCGPIAADALDDFANFMKDVVARYSGSPYYVTYYELWNEPDVDAAAFAAGVDSPFGCWGDTGDTNYGGGYYATMLSYVYPAIKQANPNAQVLVGGLLLDCNPYVAPPPGKTNCNAGRFLEGILAGGGGNYFDGVSYHAYEYFTKPADMNISINGLGVYANPNWFSSWNTTGPVLIAKTNFVKDVLNKYGFGNKYLVNSEVGLLCGGDGDDLWCNPAYNTSLAFQNTKAYYVVQSYAAAFWSKIKMNVWFSFLGWRDSGLYNSILLKPEVAYNAYKFLHQEISSATGSISLAPAAGVKGYEFTKTGKRVWILWYVGGDPNNGNLTTNVNLGSTPQSVWKWVNAGSGTANDGTYQPATASQILAIGRAPVIIELNP
jgi:hypothetical protein